MYDRNGRFSQLRWLQTIVCVLTLAGSLALVGLGFTGHGGSANLWMTAAGLLVLFVAILGWTTMTLVLKMEATTARQLTELRDLRERVIKQNSLLAVIAENGCVSDAAKAIAHRGAELDVLHAAVQEAIHAEHWETALTIVDGMDQRLGYKQEAERYREELDDARCDAIQSKLAEAVELIETHFQAHEWDLAQSEIDRLHLALPGDPKVRGLQDRMQVLKQEHKAELKRAWEEAVRRNDTDQAIDVLKGLDQYLSAGEVEALRSSARDVFKEKLLQLGVQFRFAVTEKRWQDALSTGLELVREFPNARMALEVREVLDTLRERARIATESGSVHEGVGKP